jgi:SAM-dependent methyltransferase
MTADPRPLSYDEIGRGYVFTRRPDPRIARAIDLALDDCRSVVNVGAGAGSYEPPHRRVVAVEPSRAMIDQRRPGVAPVIQAVAEHLPFADASFDAALAVLTVHHWSDRHAGLAELARVTRRRVVMLTWDPARRDAFWLTSEYLPAILDLDVPRFPSLAEIATHFGEMDVNVLSVPHDCQDGFLGAFWRRPEAYLDPLVRRPMSGFAQLPRGTIDAGIERLARDLDTGRWDQRFGHLRRQNSADLGYRLIVARPQ